MAAPAETDVKGISLRVTEFGIPVGSRLYHNLLKAVNPNNPLSVLAFKLVLQLHSPRTRELVVPYGPHQEIDPPTSGLRRRIIGNFSDRDTPGTLSIPGGSQATLTPFDPSAELLNSRGAVVALVEASTLAHEAPQPSPTGAIWPKTTGDEHTLTALLNSLPNRNYVN